VIVEGTGIGAAPKQWVGAVKAQIKIFFHACPVTDRGGKSQVSNKPNLWGFHKFASKPWPVAGAAISSPQRQVNFDLKDYLQTETISRLMVRVTGAINVNAPGAGTNGVATGRDNPESLILNLTARHTPALGVVSKNNLSPRGFLQFGIFDRGYSIPPLFTNPIGGDCASPEKCQS
jgi:hypothetical protein